MKQLFGYIDSAVDGHGTEPPEMQLCALCRPKVHDLSYGGELVPESLNLYLDRPVRDKSHLQAILLDACAQS